MVGAVSGLASGLDTASIISQLLQIERIPQNQLKSRSSTSQTHLRAIQDLNSKVAALTTKAADLAKGTSWNPLKSSADNDKVTVSPTAAGAPGQVTFQVNSLAAAHRLTFNGTAANTDLVTNGPTSVRLTKSDGTTMDIDSGDGTFGGLVKALNASNTGVRATTVRLDDGTFRLAVTSTKTGSDSDFTLTNLDGSALLGGATVRTGSDASITVGGDTVTSKTNTFDGTVNGLKITLAQGVPTATDITVTTVTDVEKARTQAKDLVDTLNGVLEAFDALAAKSRTKGQSDAYDSGLADARSRLLTSVVGTTADLNALGIETDKFGKVRFDATKFDKAYDENPTAVAEKFVSGPTPGWADRLATIGKGLSDRFDGSITKSIESRQSRIDRLDKDIDRWDDRIEARRKALEKQFTALEKAMAGLQVQGNYLSGALAGLNNNQG